MATEKALDGKPYAGNPHVRFDEGASASEEPRRKALLHRTRLDKLARACAIVLALAAQFFTPAAWADTHDKVQLWAGGPYWATTNIGAEKPEDYGLYFWWGDTNGYKRVGSAWVANDGSNDNFSFEEANAPTYNKDAATLQSEGWITVDGVLAPEHDAAQVQWGNGWRMPTKDEMTALTNNCDWTWTTTNGIDGYVVSGKGDYASNSIFLPLAESGYYDQYTLYEVDPQGVYWSSAFYPNYNVNSWVVGFMSTTHIVGISNRFRGFPIRPVYEGLVSVVFNENFEGGATTSTNLFDTAAILSNAPKVIERDGWAFVGWFDAAEGGNQILADALPTDGATYYAHWMKAVTVGSPDSINTTIPTFFNAGYSLTQQIYAPGEIGAACTLYGIAFKKNVGSKTSTRGLDVYLVHTAKSSFSGGNDWIPVAAADKVFGGSVTFATGEWTIIRFGKAFEYNGTENLAVIVDDNTSMWVSDDTSFCTFDAPGMALNVYSDSTDYNPANPSGYSGSVRNVKNHICLLTEPCGIPVWDGNLATLTTGATAFDGMVVFGELAGYPKKISIADGATVTISNVTLNSGASNYNYRHAGITCDGDAVIVLKGENSVRGFSSNYPGIFVPVGKTLTIRGDGSLAAGVCSSSHAAAIGGGYRMACGNIVIEGGNITATGGRFAPGIGGGHDGNSCGDIIIDGGSVTAIAADGGYTAAIGSGSGCNCGDITIGAGIVSVTAFTSSATPPIGAGADGVPGTITIAPGLDDLTRYSGGYTRTIIPWDGNLATLGGDVVVSDGMTITGTLTGYHKVSIADGATVTLDDASINADGAVNDDYHAGVTCNGDATIVLKGTNAVKSFDSFYPGIDVPDSSTVTIQGDGTLDVSGNGNGAGIAVGNGSTLVVAGGVITATGGENAAGIGGGNYITGGNISIVGGTVTATGGSNAPGIGSGRHGSFGTITIANTVTCVTAIKGVNAPESIGTAADASCGTVTIGGAVGAIAESPYAYCPAADAVYAVIDAIGEVTYTDESKAKIDAARAAYDALTAAQKALVANAATLTTAETAYAALKAAADAAADAAAAAVVMGAIDAIGEVAYTDESKAKIDAARAAYDALTAAQKALVANAATLTTAETAYAALKAAADAAADAAAAAVVMGAIDAIGEVAYTDESKGKIDAARAAYDALTDAQKALVTNSATLTAAEAAYAALTPKWEINQYTITFIVEGETYAAITNDYGAEVTAPKNPSKTGWTFAGWTPAVPETVPAENLVLTAQWRLNEIDIPVVLGSGTNTTVTVTIGEAYTDAVIDEITKAAQATATRHGQTVTGWTNYDGSEVTGATIVSTNDVLTAVWESVNPLVPETLGEGAVDTAKSQKYEAYILDADGAMRGTVVVTVGKANKKSGLSSVKAQVKLVGETKTYTFKATEAKGGKAAISTEAATEGVELYNKYLGTMVLDIGAEGVSGTMGEYEINGSRNFYKTDKAAYATWTGTWTAAIADADGAYSTFSVKVKKNGSVSVKGVASTGAMFSVTTRLMVADDGREACVAVKGNKKVPVGFTLWLGLDADGAACAESVESASGDAVAGEDAAAGKAAVADASEWTLAAGGEAIATLGWNGSRFSEDKTASAKVTYAKATGLFSGSYRIATTAANGKAKKTTVRFSGVFIDDVGYGVTTKGVVGLPVILSPATAK